MQHKLKTWPEYFDRVRTGMKTFEVRKNDRDYQVGDVLILEKYDPESDAMAGIALFCEVVYIFHGGSFGVEPGYCIMGIKVRKSETDV